MIDHSLFECTLCEIRVNDQLQSLWFCMLNRIGLCSLETTLHDSRMRNNEPDCHVQCVWITGNTSFVVLCRVNIFGIQCYFLFKSIRQFTFVIYRLTALALKHTALM